MELMVAVLELYGRNIVTTEGLEWRLHRKVTSRPFSEKNNQLVHEETVRQTTQMMQAWDENAKDGEVRIDKCLPFAVSSLLPFHTFAIPWRTLAYSTLCFQSALYLFYIFFLFLYGYG